MAGLRAEASITRTAIEVLQRAEQLHDAPLPPPYRVVRGEDGEISLWFQHGQQRAEVDVVGGPLVVVMLETEGVAEVDVWEVPPDQQAVDDALAAVLLHLTDSGAW